MYARQVRVLCEQGFIDRDIAFIFGVSVRTFHSWKHKHPEFLHSLKAGKAVADARVAEALYQLAIGYEHREVQILVVRNGKGRAPSVEQVSYTKRFPPNTTAAIFWLKNRRPDQWRTVQQLEHSGKDRGPVEVDVTVTRHRIAQKLARLP